MTEQPELEHRLLATGYDRDNFPRMNSERWLPVGLAKEAAAVITRLRAERTTFDCRYTLGDVADFSGVHCPFEQPCMRCQNERLRAEREQLLAALKGLVADCGDDEVEWPALVVARAAIAAVESKP